MEKEIIDMLWEIQIQLAAQYVLLLVIFVNAVIFVRRRS